MRSGGLLGRLFFAWAREQKACVLGRCPSGVEVLCRFVSEKVS